MLRSYTSNRGGWRFVTGLFCRDARTMMYFVDAPVASAKYVFLQQPRIQTQTDTQDTQQSHNVCYREDPARTRLHFVAQTLYGATANTLFACANLVAPRPSRSRGAVFLSLALFIRQKSCTHSSVAGMHLRSQLCSRLLVFGPEGVTTV